MKNLLYIILIGLSVIAAGVLITIVVFACNGHEFNFGGFDMSTAKIVKEENYTTSEVKKLLMKTTSADIKIVESEDENIKVIQYSNDENPKLFSSNLSGGELEINELNKICIFCFNRKNYFELYIPKTYKDELILKSTSGDLNSNIDFEVSRLEASTTSGDIIIPTVNSNNIITKSTSGNVRINNMKSENLEIVTTSGDININNIESKNAEIRSTSGEIRINDIISNITLKTTSGDIEANNLVGETVLKSTSGKVKVNSINGKTEINTTSGDIKLKSFLPNSDSNFKSVSGDISITMDSNSNCTFELSSTSGKTKYPGHMGEKTYNIKAKTTSGNIIIED